MGKAFDIGLHQLVRASVVTVAAEEETRTFATQGRGTQSVPQREKTAGLQTFYLETFGCQMNEHDSEKVAGVLLARGYRQVEKADAADVILYNTCSIREKAAQKVFSRLGEWRPEGGGQRPATSDRRRSGEWPVSDPFLSGHWPLATRHSGHSGLRFRAGSELTSRRCCSPC